MRDITYYMNIIKHLVIQNGYWDAWAWTCACEWDYYPTENEMAFFAEMCIFYNIIEIEDL